MSHTFDTYLAMAMTMSLLSLWKTYLGPAIAGVMLFSYPEMLMFNLLPALSSAYVGWLCVPLVRKYWRSSKRTGFKPKLRIFMCRWNRYGQAVMALLAPVLLGVPTYAAVSRRLNQGKRKTFGLLIASILFWSSAAYFSFLLLDLEQYLAFESIFPDNVMDVLNQ